MISFLGKMENLKENFWTDKNETIDNFIIEIRLKGHRKFEWIPYNQFSNIEKFVNNDFSIKNSPSHWSHLRRPTKLHSVTVNLKYLYNSQNISTSELHNEV
jgi:hypothetical protein